MTSAAVSSRRLSGFQTGRKDRRRWRVPQFNVSNLAANNSPFWQEFIEGYVEGYFR